MGWAGAADGKPKAGQSNHLDSSSSAVPFSKGPELVQSTGWAMQECRWEQPGTPCSPISAPQGREMRHRGFTVSVKSSRES